MTSIREEASAEFHSLERHGWVGLVAVLGLFGGLVAWASVTEISGAIVASGTIAVQDNAKRVQHPEGGTIAQLMARNEDRVDKGQLLAVLDQTTIGAALAISEAQLRDAYAREARLVAEIEGRTRVIPSEAALKTFQVAVLEPALELEQRVLAARRSTNEGRIAQLEEQIVQLERQREGLELQKIAVERRLLVINREISDFDRLFRQGLIESSRGTTLEKELAAAEGELGRVVSTLAESLAVAAERALEIEQIEAEFLSDVLAELQGSRQIIAEAGQRRIADRDRLSRTEIRAPQAGIVHQSTLHVVGEVAGAGETLMLIVPTDDPLLVNARIEPMNIDNVLVGQETVLRLSGLDPRTTPELLATVGRVAPDATQDPITGHPYYAARIVIADEQLARLPEGTVLVPGMPVETFMQTGDRTVLSYIVHPFIEQLNRALKEE